jgi:hypothetical protein
MENNLVFFSFENYVQGCPKSLYNGVLYKVVSRKMVKPRNVPLGKTKPGKLSTFFCFENYFQGC